MDKLLPIIIPGTIGILGAILAIMINRYFDKRNKLLASKREQLEKIFAPLEILSKVNKQEFKRFFANNSPDVAEKEFIEKSIWYPNNLEIKKIIMTQSHLLAEMPQELLDLLEHINLWLFVYESKYDKKTHQNAVFAGPKGKPYPTGADAYIFKKAETYRKILNE
ncbi:hypothetical protein [Pedobacter sp. Leaf250]|uniref:hypothetical protein n=1 Tax=Pedobacter sp. Leaf250 TaxID=2876559 RepID=UPI001E3C0A35|nr:hypothetical protein [Pedobacter sp. Leaf250]